MRCLLGLVSLMVLSLAAFCQEGPVSTIETEGVATVDAVPGYVEFSLHAHCSAATLTEATEAALKFEPNVRKALQAAELTPTELAFTGVAVPDMSLKVAHISARLRYRASTYTSAEEGPRLFALLCDKVLNLAVGLSYEVEGPVLIVEDKEAIEDAAIARATEKAYTPAKAAAQVMSGQIIAVDKVVVQSLVWNKAPGVYATQPDLQKLTCTATVKVSYAFSPA